MNRIELLDDSVIDKIAAGEVIERPASVLKELMENALDAQATSIRVELEEGGRRKILVTDNGSGLLAEDLPLAVRRHATSKLRTSEDLFCISSMGFRGEALASIASVSRLSLLSREKHCAEGAKLETEGAQRHTIYARPAPIGTTVQVLDLFYNVPVREKFLKTPQAEYAACLELVQALALARPDVSFVLLHNGKEKANWPSVVSEKGEACFAEAVLRQRMIQVLDPQESGTFLYVTEENQYGRVVGLVSPPGVEKATVKNLWTFVNGRWVKDKAIRYGALRGYHSHLLKGQYPQAVLHVLCDPSLVDVNVHPSKTELRFQYSGEIQGVLASGIRKALRSASWAEAPEGTPLTSIPVSAPRAFSFQPLAGAREGAGFRSSSSSSSRWGQGDGGFRSTTFMAPSQSPVSEGRREQSLPLASEAASILDWDHFAFIGTWFDCYLLFSDASRGLLIDQHAFHERILYEKLSRDQELLSKSQPLLIPHLVAFSPEEVVCFAEHQERLARYGVTYRVLEGKGLELTAVPAILRQQNWDALLADLLRELQSGTQEALTLHHHVLATLACHSAVRAGQRLGAEEVARLRQEAHGVDFLHNCPHGRRVFKWLSRREVEAWFDRT